MTNGTDETKLVFIASSATHEVYESVTVKRFEDSRFIHIKPTQPLPEDAVQAMVEDFTRYVSTAGYKPVVIVGDYFDVDVYSIRPEVTIPENQMQLELQWP